MKRKEKKENKEMRLRCKYYIEESVREASIPNLPGVQPLRRFFLFFWFSPRDPSHLLIVWWVVGGGAYFGGKILP